MKFVWFTLVLAVVNVALGCWLSSLWAWRRPAEGWSETGDSLTPGNNPGAAEPPDAEDSDRSPPTPQRPEPTQRPEEIPRPQATDARPSHRVEMGEESWNDLAGRLLKKAILYAQSIAALDERLQPSGDQPTPGGVDTMVVEAKDLLQSWTRDSAADSEQLLKMTAELPGGRDVVGRFETTLLALTAQAETSASNLCSLDCADPLVAGQRLGRELSVTIRAFQTFSDTFQNLRDLVHRYQNIL